MTPVTRGEAEAAVEAYGLAVLCQKYPAQPTNPVEAHDHLRSLLTRLFAERDELREAVSKSDVVDRDAAVAVVNATLYKSDNRVTQSFGRPWIEDAVCGLKAMPRAKLGVTP